MENLILAVLQSIPGIGSARIHALLSFFGSAQEIWRADSAIIISSGVLRQPECENLIGYRNKWNNLERIARAWEKGKISICSCFDEEYPLLLKEIYQPPVILFYRGHLRLGKRNIALVGSRKASAYGKNVALQLSEALSAAGFGIVSGAARGIDTAAHTGALSSDGYTVAVLGCGVDVAYPAENRRLIDQIAECGAVISEYAPGTRPNARHFPARNRIISGLSDGIAVVEAAKKSGALITAEFALEQGRDVFAVPGNIYAEGSKGCHALIRQGAKLVESAVDIQEEYADFRQNKVGVSASPPDLSAEEKIVYELLRDDEPMSMEEIILKARSDVSHIAFIILQLKLRGIIMEYTPHCYVRAVKEGVL